MNEQVSCSSEKLLHGKEKLNRFWRMSGTYIAGQQREGILGGENSRRKKGETGMAQPDIFDVH